MAVVGRPLPGPSPDDIQKEIARYLGESSSESLFIDSQIIEELSAIRDDKFDFKKLIKLCDEINVAYISKRYYSVGMLSRAILDHVPPLFGYERFKEVANNYSGGKTFKGHMQNLENSFRHVADSFLHETIQKKEVLPTKSDMNFNLDLNALLKKIIRLYGNN